jgi:AcrR family transcriptional regulator
VSAVAQRAQARQSREQTRERIVAAACELLRTRSFAELTVDQVMREVGQGRTIFYRHFDDLPQLLVRASRAAIEQLYAAQHELTQPTDDDLTTAVARALTPGVAIYRRHGPLLRGVVEASGIDPELARNHDALRNRFEELAEQALRDTMTAPTADLRQTARALNLMNESYLLDAFGREPRVSDATAVRTLTEIWDAVIARAPRGR